MTKKNSQHFQEHGFLVSKKLLNSDSVKNFRFSIFKLAQEFIASYTKIHKELQNLHEDQMIISFRNKFPTEFGVFYDRLQTSGFCVAFCTDNNILEFVSSILSTKTTNLAWAGMLLRIDVPNDKRNTVNWHQDHTYLPFGGASGSSLVLTIPLQDTTSAMGAVQIIPGSHKDGVRHFVNSTESKKLSSEQKTVEVGTDELAQSIVPELNVGDVLLMDMNFLFQTFSHYFACYFFALLVHGVAPALP